VTTRLRELIQQLGEAIHESVIESEQISGVVEDIRRHGFDVLLMLEATIALNDLAEDAEAEQVEVHAGHTGDEQDFTQNDLSFLRSLRISVTGEKDDAAGPDAK
jgi:pyridoxine 5'-phosphate synthase PdxJ